MESLINDVGLIILFLLWGGVAFFIRVSVDESHAKHFGLKV